MPIYKYNAIDAKGNMSQATMVASSHSAVATALIAKGMTPVSISEAEEGEVSFKDAFNKFGMVRLREIVLFMRMMAILIGSGITITEAIAVLHEQAVNRKFRYVLGEVKMMIEGGVSLSDALSRFPSIFPDITINVIRAGETGGMLEKIMLTLVVYMEKRAALKKALLRSFLYPSVVMVVAIGVVIFLVVFVIPKFTVLLKGSKLPWNTQFLLDVSEFMTQNTATLIMGTLGGIALVVTLFVVKDSRNFIDRHKIRLPVFGPIFQLGLIVQFARTLGSLLASGIPLVEALGATKGTLSNMAAQVAIARAAEKVASGEQLSVALTQTGIFTGLMISMVRIGEQSGNMDQQSLLVAELYEQQLEDRIAVMSSMVEPMLIIFLGGVVGFVAWALVAGMLSMYKTG